MQGLKPLTITPSGSFTRASTAWYFDKTGALQSAANDVIRITYDPVTLKCLGHLIENAATNILLNSATVANQGITVTAQKYTISFWGTGTVTLSGAHAAAVVGTGTTRKVYSFTATAGTLTLVISGTVTKGQVEANADGVATSYIVTVGSAVTRAADTFGCTFATNIPLPCTTGTNQDAALAYNPATAYGLNAITYSASTLRRYRSRQAANTGHDPTTATQDTPTDWWEDYGAVNQMAGHDLRRNTGARYTDCVVYTMKPGKRFDTVAVDDVTGAYVRFFVWRAGKIIAQGEIDMVDRNTTTWYEYVHGQFKFRRAAAQFDLPPYTDAIMCVVVDYPGSEAVLGAVGIGMAEDLGKTQLEAEADALNFSKIDRNFDGTLSKLLPRLNVPQTKQNTWADHARVDRIRQFRDDMNGQVGFYIGLEEITHSYFQSLFIKGIYRRFSLNLKHEDHAVIGVDLEKV